MGEPIDRPWRYIERGNAFAYQHTVYSRLQSSKSYTLQSADLLWQRIELETLDILTMVHHAIADRVDSHNELRKGI